MSIARAACRGVVILLARGTARFDSSSLPLLLSLALAACPASGGDSARLEDVDSGRDNPSLVGGDAASEEGANLDAGRDEERGDAASVRDASSDVGGSNQDSGSSMDAALSSSDAQVGADGASQVDASAVDTGTPALDTGTAALDSGAMEAGSTTPEDASTQSDAAISCPEPELQADGTCKTPEGACINGNGGCSQRCAPTTSAASCSCYPGFRLLADGSSCQAFDWSRSVIADAFSGPQYTGLTFSGPRAPILRLDSDGRAVVLWKATSNSEARLQGVERSAAGEWIRPTPLAVSESGVSGAIANVPVPRGFIRLADAEIGVVESSADPITISHSRAGVWSDLTPVQITDTHQAQQPQLNMASTPAGTAVLVWTALQAGRTHVYARYFTPASGLSAPLLVSADLAWNASQPRAAIHSDGTATVVWQQDDGARLSVRVRQYHPSTGFGVERRVDAAEIETTDPHVAVDSYGNLVVAYQRQVGARVSLWANRKGADWLGPQQLAAQGANTGADPRIVRLVAGARGVAYVLFQSDGLQATRLLPSTGWSMPALLGALYVVNDLLTTLPVPPAVQIGLDEIGNAVVVWRSAGSSLAFTRYVSGTGWFRLAQIAGTTGGDPGLVVLPDGRAMVAWHQALSSSSSTPASLNLVVSELKGP
jgi:hypothetical protein